MIRSSKSVIELLEDTATELAQIHRGKHYSLWRADTAPQLREALAQLEPFSAYRNVWISTGDGGCVSATPRFGEWAISRLVEKNTPGEILAAFNAEIARNAATYEDMSPLYGIHINERCDLGNGIEIVPEPADELERIFYRIPFQHAMVPTGTAVLSQTYTVTPAFVVRRDGETAHTDLSTTVPPSNEREKVRRHVRLACLLASAGAVELPRNVLRPDRRALFVAGEGNEESRMFQAHPLVSFPVNAADVARMYRLFSKFDGLDSLARSIDRLGRSRLATSPVDRVIDLGMAAEIALMHDMSPTNTEISHKIGSRAAWLIGKNPVQRATLFGQMKQLYQARSKAVHSGTLSPKSNLDLQSADHLVSLALVAILERGSFPDWNNLTFGGEDARSTDVPE